MQIIVVGLPYFANKISMQIREYSGDVKISSCDTTDIVGKVNCFFKLFLSDVVYSVGGPYSRSRIADIALFLRKKVVFHWVGTDVVLALENKKNVDFKIYEGKRVRHFSEVDWIQHELRSIGIHSEIVSLAAIETNKSFRSSIVKKNKMVLGYIGKNREEFYRLDWLTFAAKNNPDIHFKIVGIASSDRDIPKNMELLGWVSNMADLYMQASIYVRVPKHDGLSFSVLEALSYGCFVAYNYEFPYCDKVNSKEDLELYINNLFLKKAESAAKNNDEGKRYVSSLYAPEKVLPRLLNKITIWEKD